METTLIERAFWQILLEDKYFIVQAEMSDTWELMKGAQIGKTVGVMALICKTKREGKKHTSFLS